MTELLPGLMNHSLGSGSIESYEIHPLRRGGSELAQHRRHLAAMVRSMIDNVLDHVPEDRGARFSAQHLVFDHAVQSLLAHSLENGPNTRLELQPLGSKGRHVRKLVRRDESGGRLTVPAAAPSPLGGVDVGQSIAY